MSKAGFNIGQVSYVEKWHNDEHELCAEVKNGDVILTTTDSDNIKQHDFLMSQQEWSLLKQIIDIQLGKKEE